ncbi:MAG: AMP-binding protein, partial [Thermoleophilia bacterium]|nr:AMP-binding protein [Thermoleophilia bacterium]
GEPTPFVGLVWDESPAFVAAFLGLASSGWAVGVLDGRWTGAEADGALDVLAPSAVMVPAAHPWEPRAGHRPAAAPAGWRAWSTPAASGPAGPRTPGAGDAFYVGFTSGSAGRPKAFQRSHRSWWESFAGLDAFAPLGDGPVVVPGGMGSSHFLFGALHALHAGATLELRPAPDAARAGADEAPAAMYVVPTMLAHAAARGSLGTPAPRRVYCAGARLEAAVRAAVRDAFPGTEVVEYYGASELSFVAIRRDGDDTPPGSVGRAFPGVEIEVRGDDGVPAAAGERGTLHVRSPLVFMGYRGGAPAGAPARPADGWITVGDRGRVDAAGHVWVDGRGSALIITGAANVQPEEVEEVVSTAPGVASCVVVGVDDPAWGQVVCAAVEPAQGAALTRAALRAHVAGRLSAYKRPRRYVALDGPPPLGRTGKVDRAAVRALVDGAAEIR